MYLWQYKILLLPDHPTPVRARTHTHAPVPFVIYDSANERESGVDNYCEKGGEASGLYLDHGEKLLEMLLGDNI